MPSRINNQRRLGEKEPKERVVVGCRRRRPRWQNVVKCMRNHRKNYHVLIGIQGYVVGCPVRVWLLSGFTEAQNVTGVWLYVFGTWKGKQIAFLTVKTKKAEMELPKMTRSSHQSLLKSNAINITLKMLQWFSDFFVLKSTKFVLVSLKVSIRDCSC